MKGKRFRYAAPTPRSMQLFVLLVLAVALPIRADDTLPLVFEETFAQGADRWAPTDPAAWTLGKDGDRAVWGLNKRMSNYQPKVRSPHNVALVKDLELTDTVITFQQESRPRSGLVEGGGRSLRPVLALKSSRSRGDTVMTCSDIPS